MLSGTQHVSLETSWKSGGHWRHLKGLSEACLCCPGNVFHWGCSLFSFAFQFFCFFSLVSPVFVQYKLLFCKALSLVIFLIGDNNKIDFFFKNSMSVICCSLRSGVNPNRFFFRVPKILCYYQLVNSGLVDKSKRKWLSSTLKAFLSAELHANLQISPRNFWFLSNCLILRLHDPYAHTAHNPLDVSVLLNNCSPQAVTIFRRDHTRKKITDTRGGLESLSIQWVL